MFDKALRAGVERGLKPAGAQLRRVGITADQLTAAGLVISAIAALVIGSGRLFLGMVLLGLSAVPDLLDGAVAKASGTASPRGAFFDSVADRVSDALVLGGLAWYLASVDGGHAALLPLAVLAASSIVSYERARAESLGFTAKGGLMERAERMMAIAAGLIFSAVLVPILWIMLALTLFTAGQRFVMVWRQASASGSGRPGRPGRPPSSWTAGRWRGWTPGVSFGSTSSRRERKPGGSARRRLSSVRAPSDSGSSAGARSGASRSGANVRSSTDARSGSDVRAATDSRPSGARATDSGAWRRRDRSRP